jgi:hypothetical protein
MTMNIREIGVLIENNNERIERQPFVNKTDENIKMHERCKQIEWLCKLGSNFDVPRGKVSPIIKFFYERKMHLFFIFHETKHLKKIKYI